MKTKTGHVIVISGPSGVGKGTIIKRLLAELDNIELSVSTTTRAPREHEENGVHYHFKSHDEFERDAKEDAFLEWCEVHQNYYGTSKKAVLDKLEEGIDVILEIDIQGFQKVREKLDRYSSIFIAPPSFQDLVTRLKGRNTEAEDVIQTRLAMAGKELAAIGEYDYIVINKDVDHATEDVIQIVTSLRDQTIG